MPPPIYVLMYKDLVYTTKEINSNFKIKVCGICGRGYRYHNYVGVRGLISAVGVDRVNEYVLRAFMYGKNKDCYFISARRGLLRIYFYNK